MKVLAEPSIDPYNCILNLVIFMTYSSISINTNLRTFNMDYYPNTRKKLNYKAMLTIVIVKSYSSSTLDFKM